MTFVFRMAAREMRAAWRRLVFFFVCVAVGVGAIVALRSVIQSVRHTIGVEARALTAADILIQTQRPWDEDTRRILEARLLRAPVLGRAEAIETATMVRPADERKAVAKMAELRAVQAAFPLYGQVTLEDGRPYSHRLVAGRGALVRPELLAQLDLAVGDRIVIGTTTFEIRGVLRTEPGRRMNAFSLGPRILIDHADLAGTGLLTVGSRARYQVMLRVPDGEIPGLLQRLQQDFRERFVTVRSYRGAEDRISSDLERAENYLSLVGFVILILGGIGVWSVTRVFVQQKIRSIAILKCLGASTRQILAIYVVQVLLLGGGGSLLGVAIAAAGVAAVPDNVSIVATNVSYGLTASAVAQGFGIGVLVALLFSLVPLLDVRNVKPLLLLRDEPRRSKSPENAAGGRVRAWSSRLDSTRLGAGVAVVAGLVALAAWQAGSMRVGLYVTFGFAAVSVVLHLAGIGLVKAVAPLSASRWFPLRHAVLNLSRPGNQTRVILLAVGLGSFFIIAVQALQHNLLRELSFELRPDAPDLFLLDIQHDQADGVRAFMQERAGVTPRLIPVLRARVTGVKGREVNLDGYDDVRGRGSLGREYVVTYRDHLEQNERLVDGSFWGPDRTPGAEVSIEDSIRNRFAIQVGDMMRFDILGRTVTARVTSVRQVDWDDARTGGFMFLFRPEVLAAAPHSFIAVMRAPDDPVARARLQRDLVARFANVSAIDVREVLKTVESVVANVTLAISIVGAVALFSGALILIGAVAMTKFQRIYEAAIFKTLGATTRHIATMLVLEYGTLGTLAGLVGTIGGLALSWALSSYLLEISWRPAAAQNLGAIGVAGIAVATVGVAASLDVLRRKPLATLRGE